MVKKILSLIFVATLANIVTASLLRVASSGAPASSTGGPDEIHCSNSGCHDDKEINTGKAISTLKIEGLEDGQYMAGKSYHVKVSMVDPGIKRFGFQVVILDSEGKNAGKLELTDVNRTQIIQNYVKMKDRDYLTYTYNGTAALEEGKTSWEFNWTAPEAFAGKVTVYLATVSANNDNTDKGDFSYKSSMELMPSMASITTKSKTELSIVKSGNNLMVAGHIPQSGMSGIQIYDLKGLLIHADINQMVEKGNQSFDVALPTNLPSGIYVINLVNNGNVISGAKVILSN